MIGKLSLYVKADLQNLLPQLGCDAASPEDRLDEKILDDCDGIVEASSAGPFVQSVEEEDVADQLAAARVLGHVTPETIKSKILLSITINW